VTVPDDVPAVVAELAGGDPASVFAQQPVVGRLVSVGGVARAGAVLVAAGYLAIPSDRDPHGPSARIEVVDEPRALAAAARLLEELGYSGLFCLDFIVDERGEAVLIDLNPRVFGSWLALQAAGVDLLGAYLAVLSGGPPPAVHPIPVGEVRDVLALRPLPMSSWSALRSQLGSAVSALRAGRPHAGRRWAWDCQVQLAWSLARALPRLASAVREAGGPRAWSAHPSVAVSPSS